MDLAKRFKAPGKRGRKAGFKRNSGRESWFAQTPTGSIVLQVLKFVSYISWVLYGVNFRVCSVTDALGSASAGIVIRNKGPTLTIAASWNLEGISSVFE